MLIYLDTSHLQKWCNKTLPITELDSLNSHLKNNGNYYVLSVAHIFDLMDSSELNEIKKYAIFLDGLPVKWIVNPLSIFRKELINALEIFTGANQDQINVFTEHYVDLFEPHDSVLITRLGYRDSSLLTFMTELFNRKNSFLTNFENSIKFWSENQISKLANLNSQQQIREIKINYKRALEDKITELGLTEMVANKTVLKYDEVISPNQEFTEWLEKFPQFTPSIWLTYHVQFSIHRNFTQRWKKSFSEDLYHLSSLPYVDFISVDGPFYEYITRTKNAYNYPFFHNLFNKIKSNIDLSQLL